jgi:HSP20 family protein
MTSFFEKLKKGMGIEEAEKIEESSFADDSENEPKKTEETKVSSVNSKGKAVAEEKPAKKRRARKSKKIEVEEDTSLSSAASLSRPTAEEKLRETSVEQEKPSFVPITTEPLSDKKNAEPEEKWLEAEGELAIDVYQTENEVVIQSAIAGVKPENLDIAIERDILTIRGSRQKSHEESCDYFTQECYWGPFSREVVMPVEVDPERVEATMRDGILTIRIPKLLREKLRKIKVKM